MPINKNPIKDVYDSGNVRSIMSGLLNMLKCKPDISEVRYILSLIIEEFGASRAYIVEYDWERFEQNCVSEVLEMCIRDRIYSDRKACG